MSSSSVCLSCKIIKLPEERHNLHGKAEHPQSYTHIHQSVSVCITSTHTNTTPYTHIRQPVSVYDGLRMSHMYIYISSLCRCFRLAMQCSYAPSQVTFTRNLDCLNPEAFLDPVHFFYRVTRSRVKKNLHPHLKRCSGAE